MRTHLYTPIFSGFILHALCCTARASDTITVTYSEDRQPVVHPATMDGLKITANNGAVKVKDWRTEPAELTFVLKGKSSNGSFKLNTGAEAHIHLDGLALTSQEGAPLHLKNKKKATVIAADGTENTLTIVACTDTAKQKAAVIWAKDQLLLSGSGTLNVTARGNGCKGISCKADLGIERLTLNVQTLGDNLGIDTTRQAGPGGPPPDFNPDDLPEEVKAHFEEMRKHFEGKAQQGERPMMGPPPMGGGGPGGKQKYLSTCKGIKAKGTLTVHSGTVSVTTSSPGAEGMEGKLGVTVNGGEIYVHAVDDAINSGGQITVGGGKTLAISTTNDAVDSNAGGDSPAIIITGGEVLAWSQNGPPEEGLDCDFSPILVSGGTLFSIGAGMGDMPSVPTAETAQQPTALLIGLGIEKGKPVTIHAADKKGKPKGKPLMTCTTAFDFQSSSSLISCPAFRVGGKYVVTSGTKTYPLTLTEPFTISRQGTTNAPAFPWRGPNK